MMKKEINFAREANAIANFFANNSAKKTWQDPSKTLFHSRKKELSCRSLMNFSHDYENILPHPIPGIINHDHRPIRKVSHSLSPFFPLMGYADSKLFTRHERNFEGLSNIIHV